MIEQTAEDIFNSINGYDEIGIEQAFNTSIDDLQEKPFMFLRALAFVERKHAGLNHEEAKAFAMQMSLGELQEYFPDDGLEILPEEPVTEQGKGVSEPEIVPEPSPSSV
jgi:hypothetical protein